MQVVTNVSKTLLAGAAAIIFSAGVAAQNVPATTGSASASSVPAQADVADSSMGEIIVTARKRNETLISVPMVVAAVSSQELEQRAISNLDGVARIVPQLIIGPKGFSTQGGSIALRGISGPDSNVFSDQGVSFNIDGFAVAQAGVRRMSDTDIDQIEVLKGPQALFYGKNSPGGVVSIRTADPTKTFQAETRTGYEFYSAEIRTEEYISGPMTDTLGYRISGLYSNMRGDMTETTPETAPFNYQPNGYHHSPNSEDFSLRGTLKWDPSSYFSARFKFNYAQLSTNGTEAETQLISCAHPGNNRETGSVGQCTPGDTIVSSGYGTYQATVPGTYRDFKANGDNFLDQHMLLSSLELNYYPSDAITLTSVTGIYGIDHSNCTNYGDYAIILPACNKGMKERHSSEELRAVTAFHSPFNFSGGLYYGHLYSNYSSTFSAYGGNFDLFGPGAGGPQSAPIFNNYDYQQTGDAYSAYLQVIYKPIDVIEVDVGGRYSHETKRLPLIRANPASWIVTPANELTGIDREGTWNDFSPEATVAYRPTTDLTIFGSYKHGFLSGGFNSGIMPTNGLGDISYGPETVEGFEIGLKSKLSRVLLVSVDAYTYKGSDLQVSNFHDAVSSISNAAAATYRGAEAEIKYTPPLAGLSLNGSVGYNKAKYTSFPNAPCYGGQTPAAGCRFIGNAANPVQDLSGKAVLHAPEWAANAGFNYERDISNSLRIGLLGSVSYSSSLFTDASDNPRGAMPNYALVDSTVSLEDRKDVWQFAVIGRNLTNRRYWISSSDVTFSGSGTGTAAGLPADIYGAISRGREVMLRITYRIGR